MANPTPEHRLDLEAGRVFSPAAPIDQAALFAGRTQQLRRVVDAVNQRGQHAVIYGERGVGKTSLANVLTESIHAPGGQIISPHVNCDTADDYSSLWRKIFEEIELRDQRQSAGFQQNIFSKSSSVADHLPTTITTHDVRRWLKHLSEFSLLLIVIDEFDRLSDEEARTMMADTIKVLSDYHVPSTLVIVGVADTVDELLEEHQSIERALVQIPMPRMSNDELSEIIDKGLKYLSMTIDGDARRRLVELSRGLPHYTHLLGKHAARSALDNSRLEVQPQDVKTAIRQGLTEVSHSIANAHYQAISSAQSGNLFSQVLLACALAPVDDQGTFAAADVRKPMSALMGRPYDIPNFQRHLADFSSKGRGRILQRLGQPHRYRYRFRNPLMQPYVILDGVAAGLVSNEMLAGDF